ncbi:matrixin family metalloprotease [Candidatus Pacearchaeota archaeon]|nr:matrixin family metalloprotease [Candidatus Pacearchaeota archaeon]
MKFVEVLVLLLLVFVLAFGSYVLWDNLPTGEAEKGEFNTKFYPSISNGVQFYPNMRYRQSTITYYVEGACNEKKARDVERAFEILDEKTILSFEKTDLENAEIRILCSEVAPSTEEQGHFVAGEGGPSQVINTSIYSVILVGKVSLYRSEKCEEPKVALHEILHALGFDHNDNPNSIMYPTTSCDQTLDQYIIDRINELYKLEGLPDLAIGNINATKEGRYLSFEIGIFNLGLVEAKNSTLVLNVGEEEIKRFVLGDLEIGIKKILTVQNVRVPRSFDSVKFVLEGPERELNMDNNIVEVSVS